MIRREIWARVDDLFDAALDLPPEARSRWLQAVCESEPDLREHVERLLELASGSEDEEDFFRPASSPLAAGLVRRLADRLARFFPDG